jgi:uncharacterized membrane protein
MTEKDQNPIDASQKTWLGMPVNWDTKNWSKGMWNAKDERLFPPKRIGVGWTINFHKLFKSIGLLK